MPITATKASSITYHDGNLTQIATIYGDRLEQLCLIEKFAILKDIAAWGDHCCGYNEPDWLTLGEFVDQHGETPEDFDAYKLLTHDECDWVTPQFAMPLVLAIANQIAEGICLPEDSD